MYVPFKIAERQRSKMARYHPIQPLVTLTININSGVFYLNSHVEPSYIYAIHILIDDTKGIFSFFGFADYVQMIQMTNTRMTKLQFEVSKTVISMVIVKFNFTYNPIPQTLENMSISIDLHKWEFSVMINHSFPILSIH